MEKIHYTYDDIHGLVANIAHQIQNHPWTPDIMVAIGAGGFIPARILRTFLNIPLYTVTTAYYDANNQPTEQIQRIQWLAEAQSRIRGKNILLLDEVDDSGATLAYCATALLDEGVKSLALAVLHRKRKPKKSKLPDTIAAYFYGQEVEDIWIAYPWESQDIHEHNRQARQEKHN